MPLTEIYFDSPADFITIVKEHKDKLVGGLLTYAESHTRENPNDEWEQDGAQFCAVTPDAIFLLPMGSYVAGEIGTMLKWDEHAFLNARFELKQLGIHVMKANSKWHL